MTLNAAAFVLAVLLGATLPFLPSLVVGVLAVTLVWLAWKGAQ